MEDKKSDAGAASFARLLRQFRLIRGLTQEELAEKAGLSARGIGDLERGRRRAPRKDTVALLAKALALSSAERTVLEASISPRARGTSSMVLTTGPPVYLTSFVGRQRELALLRDLLMHSEVRLLTLTGAPGVGKTRLAVEVAESLRDQFADGVCFANLAPVSNPSNVLSAIAGVAADLPGIPNPGREDLSGYLRPKQMLLVLDNFEQVTAAAPAVSTLLGACPRITVLVTSRSTLRVSGEHVHEVSPLSLPDDTDRLTPECMLHSSEAVELFAQRARAANDRFALVAHNAPPIAAICRRLDGLPLAIELAAARGRLLAPDELLRALERPLSLLKSGARNAPARHRALRDALEWSYQLLPARERRMFAWLAVFADGCDLAAAGAVFGDTGDAGAGDVIEGLSALVDSSLVKTWEDPGGRRRFGMLETIKAYAQERLAEDGASERVGRQHAVYYLLLAEAAAPELLGPDQSRWYKTLEVERANFRAALTWMHRHGEVELGLRLGGALWRSWEARNCLEEGLSWLETFLGMGSSISSPFRAEAWNGAGALACALGRYQDAEDFHQQHLRWGHAARDPTAIEQAYNGLGVVAMHRGDYENAESFFERSPLCMKEVGDERRRALVIGNLGATKIYAGDLATARQILEGNLQRSRRLGMAQEVADSLNHLGLVALYQGDHAEAHRLLDESLEVAHESGNVACAVESTRGIGCVMLAQGRPAEALLILRQALRTAYQSQDAQRVVRVLDALGCVAEAGGQHRRAIHLWAATEAMRSKLGIVEHHAECAFHRKWRSRAPALDESDVSAARVAGQTMSLNGAVAYALDDEAVVDAASVAEPPSS